MGAYPQGNRKARIYKLFAADISYWEGEAWKKQHHWCGRKRTDRYKSRYRARRRYKMEILRDLQEHERLLNCFEDLWGKEE